MKNLVEKKVAMPLSLQINLVQNKSAAKYWLIKAMNFITVLSKNG